MQSTKIFEDAYFLSFGRGQYPELLKAQKELGDQTSWEYDIDTASIKIEALENPMAAYTQFQTGGTNISLETLYDTAENLGLMIAYDGKVACLRDCFIPSLLSTIEIRGSGVFKPDITYQAIGFSAWMKGCRKHSHIMTRAGKVTAIVSPKYEYMPISTLLQITDGLSKSLGVPNFVSGCVSHSLTVAKFEYPDAAKAMTDTYRNALAAHGRTMDPNEQVMPVVEFRSSDTTGEAAKLLTYLQLSPGHLMPIGEGVHVNHVTPYEFDENGVRISAIQKFQNESDLLYSRLDYDVKVLVPAMLNTPIEYPANTFVGLCKKAQIPQKWGGVIEEEIRQDWPDHSGCTFLDVYEYLTSTTKLALEENDPHSERLLNLEEAIARIAHNQVLWKKYDVPGTVAWVQSMQ